MATQAKLPLDPTEYLSSLIQNGQQMWKPFVDAATAAMPAGVREGAGGAGGAGDAGGASGAAGAGGAAGAAGAGAGETAESTSTPAPSASDIQGTFGSMMSTMGTMGDPFAAFNSATQMISGMQQESMRQMTDMWLSMSGMGTGAAGAAASAGADSGAGAAAGDRRFAADAWRSDPRYKALADGYLQYSKFLRDSVESAPMDDKAKDQLRFAVRQYVDAMSPTNFLALNPEAIQLALETGGQSLVEGMNLLAKDIARGRVSMTDEEAFEVGKNVGVTPGSVVFQNELIQLIQYSPSTPEVHARPLVIIPPCINKYYILDLTPENSFVRYAVSEGHTVFLVSWKNITAAEGSLTWDDYLTKGVMKGIEVGRAIAGSDTVDTLGFCIGGTLLTSALAVMRKNGDESVESVTLLTTMLDFGMPGEIGALITPEMVQQRESAIGNAGVLEGKDLALAFSALRANDLIWPYVVNSYLKGKAPPAFDLLYWNSDGTNLPGPMFCYYVRNMYMENNLREPGRTKMCGVPVDLSDVDVPSFIYASREDHIVPWTSAFESTKLLSGDITFVLGASGHIAGVVNPPAKKKRNFWRNAALPDDPEGWLEAAEIVAGSWWPEWSGWLRERAGPMVAAPKKPGNKQYKSIEAAPGSYVLQKN